MHDNAVTCVSYMPAASVRDSLKHSCTHTCCSIEQVNDLPGSRSTKRCRSGAEAPSGALVKKHQTVQG